MRSLTGILLVAVSSASFGTLAIFGRFAYADGVDIFTLLFFRFTASALFMTLILLLRKEPLPRGRILAQLIGMGALGYVAGAYLYLTAIKYASAGLVALLLFLYPLFVAILSVIILKERMTRVKIIALILALTGTALTVRPEGGQLIGIVMAIMGAVVYSVYIIVGTGVMKHVTPVQSSTVIFASAGLVFGLLMLINGIHLPESSWGWYAMVEVILICTVIPVVTFLAGLERIGPTNASLLSALEPVVTVLLAAWLFGERLSSIILLGGALILTAVLLLTRAEMQTKRVEGI